MPSIKKRVHKSLNILVFILIIVLLSGALFLLADEANYEYVKLKRIRAAASSTLVERGRPASQYAAKNAFDGDIKTAWCEGKKDAGIGETLSIDFPPTPASGISILNGFGKSRTLYFKNNRVKDYEITLIFASGEKKVIKDKFDDDLCGFSGHSHFDTCEELARDECSDDKCYQRSLKKCKDDCIMSTYDGGGGGIAFTEKDSKNGESIKCITGIRIKILSVYPGKNYNDTCIAEVSLELPVIQHPDDPRRKLIDTACSGK